MFNVGSVNGHVVVKWGGFYYVNPVQYVGGVCPTDPRFTTLHRAYAWAKAH